MSHTNAIAAHILVRLEPTVETLICSYATSYDHEVLKYRCGCVLPFCPCGILRWPANQAALWRSGASIGVRELVRKMPLALFDFKLLDPPHLLIDGGVIGCESKLGS